MIVEADMELIEDSFATKEIEPNSKALREPNRGRKTRGVRS